MDKFTCNQIKDVVYMLMSEPQLKNKIFVAGGIVPWILSDGCSNRKHNDVDIVVEKDNMTLIREFLKENGYYQKNMDSLFLSCNSNRLDCGVEALINGVPVNFAPFEIINDDIIQRNFSLATLAGFDALLFATIKDISVADYITTYSLKNGIEIGSYALEAVKAAKETSNREKDTIDLFEIEKIGIDRERYERLKFPIQNMQISYIADE